MCPSSVLVSDSETKEHHNNVQCCCVRHLKMESGINSSFLKLTWKGRETGYERRDTWASTRSMKHVSNGQLHRVWNTCLIGKYTEHETCNKVHSSTLTLFIAYKILRNIIESPVCNHKFLVCMNLTFLKYLFTHNISSFSHIN